jgi:hypothetical protein
VPKNPLRGYNPFDNANAALTKAQNRARGNSGDTGNTGSSANTGGAHIIFTQPYVPPKRKAGRTMARKPARAKGRSSR